MHMQTTHARPGGAGRFRARRRPVARAVILALLAAAGTGLLLPAFAGEDEPEYPHGDFVEDCALCHGDDGWTPAVISPEFDHGSLSGFSLEGAHRTATCRSCHASLVFAEAPADCNACHRDVHLGELGDECARCHTPRSFIDRPRFLRMHTETRFPLVGGHLAAECEACHRPQPEGGRQWVGLPPECETCHIDRYRATTDPSHVANGFPTDCAACHTPIAWSRARFDHSLTGFSLVGAHRGLDCTQCHVGGSFTGTRVDCLACHRADYEGTTNPDHGAAGFPTDCALCHGPTDWKDATFDHALTSFPLTGAHRAVDCTRCHTGGVYTGTPTDCWSCHRDDYERTTDPNHVTAGFPTDCTQCHDTSSWAGANFDHDRTNFPLTGAHRPLDCVACHAGGVYAGTPTDCWSCHRSDYEGTRDPDHQAAGFPTDCTQCHDTTNWNDAGFDHDPWFPIYSGKHRGKWDRCSDCHVQPNNFSVFSCFGCHPHSDRNKTDDQHKDVAGYRYDSQACYSCHPDGRKP